LSGRELLAENPALRNLGTSPLSANSTARQEAALTVRGPQVNGPRLQDFREHTAECVKREIAEEAGFHVRVDKLAAVWDYRRHGHVSRHPFSIYKMFFRCEIIDGEARGGIETSEVGFFAEDALPDLSIGRVTAPQIKRMSEHWRRPELPTDFD
jgi:ADP-ribose pyrophosphatase YjhB (NUDIX family)